MTKTFLIPKKGPQICSFATNRNSSLTKVSHCSERTLQSLIKQNARAVASSLLNDVVAAAAVAVGQPELDKKIVRYHTYVCIIYRHGQMTKIKLHLDGRSLSLFPSPPSFFAPISFFLSSAQDPPSAAV